MVPPMGSRRVQSARPAHRATLAMLGRQPRHHVSRYAVEATSCPHALPVGIAAHSCLLWWHVSALSGAQLSRILWLQVLPGRSPTAHRIASARHAQWAITNLSQAASITAPAPLVSTRRTLFRASRVLSGSTALSGRPSAFHAQRFSPAEPRSGRAPPAQPIAFASLVVSWMTECACRALTSQPSRVQSS